MNIYGTASLVATVAAKTRTPVMVIMTQSGCAGSQRFRDIDVPAEARGELMDTDQVFLTFENAAEAIARFDAIMAGYPEPSDTTLGIEVLLALPGFSVRQFRQHHGDADGRVFIDAVAELKAA